MLRLTTSGNYTIALIEGSEPDLVGVTGEVYRCGMALIFCNGTSLEVGNEIAYAECENDARALVDAFNTGVAKPSIAITLARARGTAVLLERQRYEAAPVSNGATSSGGVDLNHEGIDDHIDKAVVQIPRFDS